MQRQGDFRLGYLNRPTVLPMPFRPFSPEYLFNGLSVNEQLKLTRRPFGVEARHPIARANPEVISTSGRESNGGSRILDRHAHPVGQQNRRTHLVHELLIELPPAEIVEPFGLEQNNISRSRRACKKRYRQYRYRYRKIRFHSQNFSPRIQSINYNPPTPTETITSPVSPTDCTPRSPIFGRYWSAWKSP